MRKFGLEVEYGGSGTGDAIQAAIEQLRLVGLTNTASAVGYTDHSQTHWVVKRDGSVSSGGEMVSPPLDFDDPDKRGQVNEAVAALRKSGAKPIPAAGIHVHIGCEDLTPKQVAAVALNFIKFEDVIYRLASSGWQSMRPGASSFCKPFNSLQTPKFARVKTLKDLEIAYFGYEVGGRVGHSDVSRYCGLNIQSWFFRKTIEFRVFNSSLNADRIQAYIAVCMALVQDARNGNKRSVAKPFHLGGMLDGTTDAKSAYHRFQQVVRYSGDMGLEDYKLMNKCWKDSRPQQPISPNAYGRGYN